MGSLLTEPTDRSLVTALLVGASSLETGVAEPSKRVAGVYSSRNHGLAEVLLAVRAVRVVVGTGAEGPSPAPPSMTAPVSPWPWFESTTAPASVGLVPEPAPGAPQPNPSTMLARAIASAGSLSGTLVAYAWTANIPPALPVVEADEALRLPPSLVAK